MVTQIQRGDQTFHSDDQEKPYSRISLLDGSIELTGGHRSSAIGHAVAFEIIETAASRAAVTLLTGPALLTKRNIYVYKRE